MRSLDEGSLVTVQFTGEVARDFAEGGAVYSGGFWLKVPYDALLRTPETHSWIPPTATVQVVRPARPREVLLLDCGHVQHQLPAEAAVGEKVYCWRHPCQATKSVLRIGSVTW